MHEVPPFLLMLLRLEHKEEVLKCYHIAHCPNMWLRHNRISPNLVEIARSCQIKISRGVFKTFT